MSSNPPFRDFANPPGGARGQHDEEVQNSTGQQLGEGHPTHGYGGNVPGRDIVAVHGHAPSAHHFNEPAVYGGVRQEGFPAAHSAFQNQARPVHPANSHPALVQALNQVAPVYHAQGYPPGRHDSATIPPSANIQAPPIFEPVPFQAQGIRNPAAAFLERENAYELLMQEERAQAFDEWMLRMNLTSGMEHLHTAPHAFGHQFQPPVHSLNPPFSAPIGGAWAPPQFQEQQVSPPGIIAQLLQGANAAGGFHGPPGFNQHDARMAQFPIGVHPTSQGSEIAALLQQVQPVNNGNFSIQQATSVALDGQGSGATSTHIEKNSHPVVGEESPEGSAQFTRSWTRTLETDEKSPSTSTRPITRRLHYQELQENCEESITSPETTKQRLLKGVLEQSAPSNRVVVQTLSSSSDESVEFLQEVHHGETGTSNTDTQQSTAYESRERKRAGPSEPPVPSKDVSKRTKIRMLTKKTTDDTAPGTITLEADEEAQMTYREQIKTLQKPKKWPTDNQLDEIFNGKESSQIVAARVVPMLLQHDLAKLRPQIWLNDKIVDSYLYLLRKRSTGDPRLVQFHPLTSDIVMKIEARKYSGITNAIGCNVFNLKVNWLIVPFCAMEHWICTLVDLSCKRIYYYNSLVSHRTREFTVPPLIAWLEKEQKDVGMEAGGFEVTEVAGLPQQQNKTDCGIYMLLYVDQFAQHQFPQVDATTINSVRRRMAKELVCGRLARPGEI